MEEDPSERLQRAVDNMFAGIKSNQLRILQQNTYLKMAKCYDRPMPDAQVNACIGEN